MDIKEKNLIQESFEIEADEIGFCLDQKWGDYENPYENSDTALAFDLFKKGWLAKSRLPDGFVLVEVDTLKECMNWSNIAYHESWSWLQGEQIEQHREIIKKAIKSQEPDHE